MCFNKSAREGLENSAQFLLTAKNKQFIELRNCVIEAVIPRMAFASAQMIFTLIKNDRPHR